MSGCKKCGSYAINEHLHGRDGSDSDLCDVCYWRKRSDELLEVVRLVLRIADGDSDLQRQLALDQNSPLVDAVREAISKAECKV